VLNSYVLRKSLLTFSVVLCCDFLLGSRSHVAFAAEEPSYTPPPFACEVRYHFREHLRDAEPGEKSVSAPAFEREGLPASRVVISDGLATRIVEGRVAHLPYQFLVKIGPKSNSEVGTFEISVLDGSGKPVTGFPQVMPNPLTKTGDSSRKEFELPVTEAVRTNIEKTLLKGDQFLTHVDLIVGMDEDFISQQFAK